MMKSKLIKIGSILAIIFILLIVGVYLFKRNEDSSRPGGPYLEIKGLTANTTGKPKNREALNYMKEQLLTVVNLNLEEPIGSGAEVNFTVRPGSFKQDYDEDTSVHTVSFIVDSEILQQSYRLLYQWPGSGYVYENEPLKGSIKCLDEGDVIFDNFVCVAPAGDVGWAQHPILKVLPYNGGSYEITPYPLTESTLYISLFDENGAKPLTEQEALTLKNEAISWIQDQGFNPDDFFYIYQ